MTRTITVDTFIGSAGQRTLNHFKRLFSFYLQIGRKQSFSAEGGREVNVLHRRDDSCNLIYFSLIVPVFAQLFDLSSRWPRRQNPRPRPAPPLPPSHLIMFVWPCVCVFQGGFERIAPTHSPHIDQSRAGFVFIATLCTSSSGHTCSSRVSALLLKLTC